MAIALREVTQDNWWAVVNLALDETQKNWVAPNWVSLLEAHYEGGTARALYAEAVLVGFTLYEQDEDSGRWYILRLMIALEHQGKGYGRAALHAIIHDMRRHPACSDQDIYISFMPDNAAARHLYSSAGFEDTGKLEEGEVVFRLPANRIPR